MSAAMGLGGFLQGLTQGYVVGDKMLTNEQEREMRGLQINKAKRELTRDSEIDAARTELVSASKNLIADQSPENLDAWKQSTINYYTIAKPEELNALNRTFKNEKIEDAARAQAQIIKGLVAKDPAALDLAMKSADFNPHGFQLDKSKTGYTENGVRFGYLDKDGQPAGEKELNGQQLVQMGILSMTSPDKSFEGLLKMFEGSADRGTKERGQNLDYKAATARTNVISQGQRDTKEYHQAMIGDRNLQNDIVEIQRIFAPRVQAIKDNIDAKLDEKTQARMLGDIEARAGYVDSVVRKNAEMGIRVPVRQVAANVDSLMKGEGIVGVPKGMENSGYGLTAQGYLVPLPPNAKVTPKK